QFRYSGILVLACRDPQWSAYRHSATVIPVLTRICMFIDWLTVSQVFDFDLPVISDTAFLAVDTATHEILSTSYRATKYEGSYSSTLKIKISGRKITVDGNPSRINRHDNLFGFETVSECISVFNSVMSNLGLPSFTRCTRVEIRDGESGGKAGHLWSDGCVIHRIDLTTNVAVGSGNEMSYIRALATQRIGHSIGFLYPNGQTTDWTTSGHGKGARLQYRKVYNKAFDLINKHLPKVKLVCGETSEEFKYAQGLYDYCVSQGIVRFEQELKDEFLKKKGLSFWGLFDEGIYSQLHREFLDIDQRLKVTKMDQASIAQQLLLENVVDTPRQANTTAYYASLWMNDQELVLSQRSFETHAARLNRIGINIRNVCDIRSFSTVFIREMKEITPAKNIQPPSFYKRASHLRSVA
ncbi:phage/plasmid replication protein, partial [Pseudomonas savastanoi]